MLNRSPLYCFSNKWMGSTSGRRTARLRSTSNKLLGSLIAFNSGRVNTGERWRLLSSYIKPSFNNILRFFACFTYFHRYWIKTKQKYVYSKLSIKTGSAIPSDRIPVYIEIWNVVTSLAWNKRSYKIIISVGRSAKLGKDFFAASLLTLFGPEQDEILDFVDQFVCQSTSPGMNPH